MTVALHRLAASFADGVFKRGDSLLLWRGGAGHVENFFLQNRSVEIVHAVAQRELREKTTQQIRGSFGCGIKFDFLDVRELATVRDYYTINRALG